MSNPSGSDLLTLPTESASPTVEADQLPSEQAPSQITENITPTITASHTKKSESIPVLMKLKFILLKAINLTALGFLEPIVRLCYKEEPQLQIRKITQFVIIPLLVIIGFLLVWDLSSARIKTKTGTLPNPSEVWSALSSIMEVDRRENEKLEAFSLSGESQIAAIEKSQETINKLEKQLAIQKTLLAEHETRVKDYLQRNYLTSLNDLNTKKDSFRDLSKNRIEIMSEKSNAGASQDEIYSLYAQHESLIIQEREELSSLEERIEKNKTNDYKLIALQLQEKGVRQIVNNLSDERMHQTKMLSILQTEGKTSRLNELNSKYEEVKNELKSASGLAVYNQAKLLYKFESKIESANESSYAKAWTLPMQIWRSIVCVFSGFVVGSVIAIPIGVLCGLSKTFMAAMTPFIAILKPVSPIVWLLIFWVIVSGLIPNPDNHWLIKSLGSLPLIGWMQINPAFISSALTVAMCSLWPTLVNTALGVASVDQDHINVAKVLRLGFWNRLFKIVLPSALPLIFAGMRISLGVGWMVLVAAELLAGSEGVGKFTWDMFNNSSSDSFAKIMVMVFVVGFIGLLLDRIMIIFQRLVSFEGSVAAI